MQFRMCLLAIEYLNFNDAGTSQYYKCGGLGKPLIVQVTSQVFSTPVTVSDPQRVHNLYFPELTQLTQLTFNYD